MKVSILKKNNRFFAQDVGIVARDVLMMNMI